MRQNSTSLKPGNVAAFDNGRLRWLHQENETWEADFRALPKPMMQTETHYLGMVVPKRCGSVLAELQVVGRPSVNDLAALLAEAMRHPLTKEAHRPSRLHVRGHRQWQELFPHLGELGIKVSVTQELPKFRAAYEYRQRQMQEARRARMVKPTEEQAQVEKLFPAIAQWVRELSSRPVRGKTMNGFIQLGPDASVLFISQGGTQEQDAELTEVLKETWPQIPAEHRKAIGDAYNLRNGCVTVVLGSFVPGEAVGLAQANPPGKGFMLRFFLPMFFELLETRRRRVLAAAEEFAHAYMHAIGDETHTGKPANNDPKSPEYMAFTEAQEAAMRRVLYKWPFVDPTEHEAMCSDVAQRFPAYMQKLYEEWRKRSKPSQ